MVRREVSHNQEFAYLINHDVVLPVAVTVADVRGQSDPGLADFELSVPCSNCSKPPGAIATLPAGTTIHVTSAWYTFNRGPGSVSETYGIATFQINGAMRRAQFSWRVADTSPQAPWEVK